MTRNYGRAVLQASGHLDLKDLARHMRRNQRYGMRQKKRSCVHERRASIRAYFSAQMPVFLRDADGYRISGCMKPAVRRCSSHRETLENYFEPLKEGTPANSIKNAKHQAWNKASAHRQLPCPNGIRRVSSGYISPVSPEFDTAPSFTPPLSLLKTYGQRDTPKRTSPTRLTPFW